MPRRPRLLALALAALHPVAARADPPPDAAHAGLMLRAALGVGYVGLRGDDTPLEVSGVAVSTHLAVGWYVVPNLAVHATLWSGSAFNPPGTTAAGTAAVSRDNTPSCSGRGLGVTWVFGATNAFASLSVGAGSVSLESAVADIALLTRAAPGVAFDLMVGKQFAMSSGWRFGVAAQGFFQRNAVTSRLAAEDVTSGGAALLGTLTYH